MHPRRIFWVHILVWFIRLMPINLRNLVNKEYSVQCEAACTCTGYVYMYRLHVHVQAACTLSVYGM